MSRRPTPDRAAQNQQVIKNLLKLECNKTCADCKRNKHPRWASWNLGIFICIRCSGIHRGMGTHISRVKSVDLDSWTDEQLQNVIKWGNARANKYWEAKLAPGHIPSEAKIENFIRTKYESKRWVMDGPMPDPATLDDGDDDVPLAVVQEKAKLERSASQRVSSTSSQPAPQRQSQSVDLFGDDIVSPPARPSTTDPPASRPPQQKSSQPAPKQTKPADSLLGLDFFGSSQPAGTGSRPASTSSTPGGTGMSRPDLKQSILSLYATAPKPQPQPSHDRSASFASFTSPQSQSQSQSQSSNLGALTDAFSGLTFSSTTSAPPQKQQEKPSPFSNLANFASVKSAPAAPKVTSPNISSTGGGLFDSLTTSSNPSQKPQGRTPSTSSNGLDFSFTKTATAPAPKPNSPPTSASKDLFDLSSPPITTTAPTTTSPPAASSPLSSNINSVFNLSKPAPAPEPQPAPKPVVTTTASILSSSIDPWGSDAWNTPDPAPASTAPSSMMKIPDTLTANDIGSGWGISTSNTAAKSPPTVSGDEDFGGWASAMPISTDTTTTSTKTAGGFGGTDDLFSNVWQ